MPKKGQMDMMTKALIPMAQDLGEKSKWSMNLLRVFLSGHYLVLVHLKGFLKDLVVDIILYRPPKLR
jgi:hypothetical protein